MSPWLDTLIVGTSVTCAATMLLRQLLALGRSERGCKSCGGCGRTPTEDNPLVRIGRHASSPQ